jgi:RHS repeat-associated protein
MGNSDTPFLFNGRYGVMTDPNSLLYMQARYYNPYICRFINADPSGFSGGMNFYAFANGNPVSLVDPFGLGASQPEGPTWFDQVATGDTSHQAEEQRGQALAGLVNFVTLGLAGDASVALTGRDLANTRDVHGVERGLAWFNLAAAMIPLDRIANIASKATSLAAETAENGAAKFAAESAEKFPQLESANFGNSVHYDQLNGGTGAKLPTELTERFPETEFQFTPRGQKGVDAQVVGGMHPSEYPGSAWPPGYDFGDWKPMSSKSFDRFAGEINSGKLPQNTVFLGYDRATGKLLW